LGEYAFPVDAHGMLVLHPASNPHEPGSGAADPEISVTLSSLKLLVGHCTP
jgi:hypothetical protein